MNNARFIIRAMANNCVTTKQVVDTLSSLGYNKHSVCGTIGVMIRYGEVINFKKLSHQNHVLI